MANAKIFRINYKSDFILTLTSDAGWMTPFCIKFWTGAPSQAYYVGWDGETYTHCSFDPAEPTKLQVQFDDHHLPIGDLKFQVAYHFTVADFPNDTEDEVINPANITTEIDGETYQVMLDFTGETAPEIQFALPAYANELQRIANEQQRIAAETQRIANEEQRILNEQQRINQEQTRQQNEQQRINQEQARVDEYAGLKADAVAATDAANDAATLANQKAQLAADKAALAQAAADLANQKAQLAADKAALAASAAQLANDKAALAQQKAEYALAQGDYAKDQGDYAKTQGDTALADHRRAEADHEIAADDHTQAGNDHTRAESDHGIAVDDHTQAGNDHTRAESDHGIAVDDHTQAGNDHTRAESDHSIAVDDHTQAGNDHTRAESDHTRAESDHDAVELYVDSLGVFDLSKHNAVGGVLATYADLDAALTALNSLESKYKYGGMSFKFVQSSDNKYVQYRLMADEWSTTVTDWQGVDETPVVDSKNLVESGGVAEETNYINQILQGLFNNKINQLVNVLQERVFTAGYVDITNGVIRGSSTFSYSNFIKVNNETYIAECDTSHQILVCYYDSQKTFLSGIAKQTGSSFTVPNNASYMVVSINNDYIDTTKISPYFVDKTIYLQDIVNLDLNAGVLQILNRLGFGFNNINSVTLFGKEVIFSGKYISPTTGNLISNSDLFATDYIVVDENKDYFVQNCNKLYGAWYNSSKGYISGITDNSTNIQYKKLTAPQNAKYIRLSTDNSKLSVAVFGVVDVLLSDLIIISKHPSFIQLNEKTNTPNYIVDKIATTCSVNSFDVVPGKFILPSNGVIGTNSLYSATEGYIPVEANKTYYFYGFTNIYGAWYDSNKTKTGDGIIRENSNDVYSVISPNDASYLRVSGLTTVFAGCFISQSDFILNPNIKVPVSQVTGIDNIEIVKYDVKPNGGGDFTKLSDCFDAITDSSINKRYIVNFYGDGTEYDTLVDKPYVSGQIGLRIPPFTKLVGVGGKEKNILVRRLQIESADQNDSLLNLYMTSELQGFTLIAEKTRYVVHDDYYTSGELNHLDYERHISDIEVLGSNMYYDQVWGAGCRSGANWLFENCIFKSSQSLSYTCHNNSDFTNIAKQKFINCRFITTGTTSIRFGSITNDANNINNIVEFYGCVLKYVNLTEEKPATLGRGILFKVTGFGNDLQNGSANLVITNTDGEDYSANIDLI